LAEGVGVWVWGLTPPAWVQGAEPPLEGLGAKPPEAEA